MNPLHELVKTQQSNICEITVIQNGIIRYEDFWNGFAKGDALNVMSVTKSVMALLTGIAVDKGYIQSISQKVMEFFPDYQVKRGEKTIYDVTIRHLLTMSAPYKYRSEPWKKVCTSQDWTRAALDLLGGRSGITNEFKYSTLGIQILCGILEHATGMPVIDFANQYLFAPLGIPKHLMHGDSSKEDQLDFLMNKGPRRNEWYSDPMHCVTAGWGLTLSATDMATIGEMCLRKGMYKNRRIVSENWIEQMTAPYRKLGQEFGNLSYGYLWWITDENAHNVAAIGDGGNVIYVNPGKDIVVAAASTFKPRVFDRVEFIEKEIIPVFESI